MAKGATATRARRRGDAAGEPEMVQLLTPDGERIKLARDTHGNEYTVDFTDEEYRRLYRDMVVVRRLDTEARPCSDRASWASGPACAGRRRHRWAPAGRCEPGHGVPHLPRARSALLPRDRPELRCACSAASTTGRGTPAGPGSALHDVSARRRCTRPGTRWGWPGRQGRLDEGEAVIAYFGDGATRQGDVNEAFVWASVFRAPIVFFCRTTSSRSRRRSTVRPACRCIGGPRIRLPGRAGRRQRRPRHLRGDPGGARRARHGEGTEPGGGLPPTGWAPTRPPTIRPGTAGRARSRPGRRKTPSPGCGHSYPRRARRRGLVRRGRPAGHREARRVRERELRCPTRPSRCSTTSSRPPAEFIQRTRASYARYRASFQGGEGR